MFRLCLTVFVHSQAHHMDHLDFLDRYYKVNLCLLWTCAIHDTP